jgi:hypothetical protein
MPGKSYRLRGRTKSDVYVLRQFSVVEGDVRERGCAQGATQDVAHQWRTSVTALLNAAAPEGQSG